MNRAVIVTVVVITVHREVKVTVQTRTVEIAVIEHLTPVGTTTGQTIPVPVMVLPIRTTAVTETGELLRGYRNSASWVTYDDLYSLYILQQIVVCIVKSKTSGFRAEWWFRQ